LPISILRSIAILL